MKKGILILLIIGFIINSKSQTLLNNDFSLHDGTNFNSWTGKASIYQNLVPQGGNAAKISTDVLVQNLPTCLKFVIGKDGKQTCAQWGSVTKYTPVASKLHQTIYSPNVIPAFITADVKLENIESFNGAIKVEGFYQQKDINITLNLTNENVINGKINIPISFTPNNCVNCPQDSIRISIISLTTQEFSYVTQNTLLPNVIIDNIIFEGTHSETDTTKSPSINNITSTSNLPNEAIIKYNINSFKETSVVVKYGLNANELTNTTSGNLSNTNLLNLTPETIYFYKVVATNKNGVTESNIYNFTTATELISLAHYKFNNNYVDVNNLNTFSSNSGTSFVTDRFGNNNSALQIVNTGTSATIVNLPYGNTSRTVSLWVKINNFNPNNYNMLYSYGTSQQNLANGAAISNSLIYHLGYINNHSLNTTITAGNWDHFVFTYDGSNSKIYKNGVLQGTSIKAWNTTLSNNLFRLGIGVGNEYWFDGAIDDLMIFNSALNEDQISKLFNEKNEAISGLNEEKVDKIVIWPNPAKNTINTEEYIEIYSISGLKILEGSGTIDINNLEPGAYFIKSLKGNSKFIKE